ncbi:MAG: hypothetical protein JWQ35_1382, partial [Bacteriovoracaceae bacterium]|nr:hypothetical protein [Bacteriovoracaceae bacterium]
PNYFLYSFRFKNLAEIKELYPYLRGPEKNSNVPRELDVVYSPLVLLPPDTQQKVIDFARKRAIQVSGVDPLPHLKIDKQTEKIINAILDHHANLKGKGRKGLTNQEYVDALDQHVEIIRIPGGKNYVVLDAQGKDIQYHEVFAAENPYIITDFGPADPFAYHLNGAIVQAQGGMLILDEYPRNPPEFRDTLLRVIQSRKMKRGGSPDVPLDIVIAAAGNDQSIDKMKEGTAHAHLDRAGRIPFRLSFQPWEIAKTMLLMNGEKTLLMKKLDGPSSKEAADGESSVESSASWVPGKLNDLYPIPMHGEGLIGPERRYAIAFKSGPNDPPVQVAPHALDFMAYVIASTRIVTDVALAEKEGRFGVIRNQIFSDFISRLKVLTGNLNVKMDERLELKELSKLLQEGSLGISNRHAAYDWLTTAIATARKPENENTLTPSIILETFDQLLQDGAIVYPDAATRLDWMHKIVAIGKAFVVEWIESDVNEAMSSGKEAVDEIYDEIKFELLAQSEDRDATRYTMPGRKPRDINFARLNTVKDFYRRSRGRALEATEVMNFHVQYGQTGNGTGARHDGLLNAINKMLASKESERFSWDALANYGRTRKGDSDIAGRYSRLASYMVRSLGYNERSLQMALEFKQQLEKTRSKNLAGQ